MTSSEEQRALRSLAALLASDLSKVDNDELADAVKQAETVLDSAPDWSGRLIATLHRRGMSWADIVKMTGLPQTTAWRRAAKYM